MIKQFYFYNSIQHVSIHFKCQTVLFDPSIGPDQMLPLLTRVDLKGYSPFPKGSALLEPIHSLAGLLPLCREVVGIFYSPSRVGSKAGRI